LISATYAIAGIPREVVKMNISRKLMSPLTVLVLAASVASVSPQVAEAAPAAAVKCWCVIYVQNYIGHINTQLAKDAGPPLRAMGYHENTSPIGINDIVVLQPGFVRGVDPQAGHIAFLASYRVSGGTVSVTLRGADQPVPGENPWTDHNCYNVTLWSFSYSSSNNWGIKYYRK
jgi:hypothetical protein